MTKKRPDPYEQQKLLRHQAYISASTLLESFPDLLELRVQMSFENSDWGGNPDNREELFNENSKAFFEFECPHVECVNGGFNLLTRISQLYNEHLTELSGSTTCEGWQDRERIGRHHCWLKMNYRIVAKYKEGN